MSHGLFTPRRAPHPASTQRTDHTGFSSYINAEMMQYFLSLFDPEAPLMLGRMTPGPVRIRTEFNVGGMMVGVVACAVQSEMGSMIKSQIPHSDLRVQ